MAPRADRPEGPEINFDFSVGTGLSGSQFRQLMQEIKTMSENVDASLAALNAELADTRATVEQIAGSVDALEANLTAAREANAALQAQIAQLTADAAVSQTTIDALNAAAAAASTAIDAATADLNTLDETLEGVVEADEDEEEPV